MILLQRHPKNSKNATPRNEDHRLDQLMQGCKSLYAQFVKRQSATDFGVPLANDAFGLAFKKEAPASVLPF
jgi:hypothetical protein